MPPLTSQQFLKNRSDTLCVFLSAPREDKVRRLLDRGNSEKEAEEFVDSIHRERADFIHKCLNVECDRAIYHTMIDTEIGDGAVANMILDLNCLGRQLSSPVANLIDLERCHRIEFRNPHFVVPRCQDTE